MRSFLDEIDPHVVMLLLFLVLCAAANALCPWEWHPLFWALFLVLVPQGMILTRLTDGRSLRGYFAANECVVLAVAALVAGVGALLRHVLGG
jgi:hypothetical protein